MHGNKVAKYIALTLLAWLLLNFAAGVLTLWDGHTNPWYVAYAFTGVTQIYVLMVDSFPRELYSVPYYCISVPLFVLLLWYWLRKPTVFKAFFLLAVGPIWGLFFTSHIDVASFSFWWFCLFLSLGLVWKIGCLAYRHWPRLRGLIVRRA